ncbi:MAG TPA: hypothetical protein PLP42_02655 [Acidobacteriota bacterium]|jgi:hypothetical protein|nr:hypothetical protein [Acidobacteriota bacterium]
MEISEFKKSIQQEQCPPADLPRLLQALWWESKGDWNRAHQIAQAAEGPEAARVHAYLHRKEGDLGNASYWYRKSGLKEATEPLDQEWEAIATALLSNVKAKAK